MRLARTCPAATLHLMRVGRHLIRYDSPRDQAIATQRGRQVAGWSQRLGSALGRLLRP